MDGSSGKKFSSFRENVDSIESPEEMNGGEKENGDSTLKQELSSVSLGDSGVSDTEKGDKKDGSG